MISGTQLGSLTEFECFIACDSVNSLGFFFDKRKVVSTIVKVLDKFTGA